MTDTDAATAEVPGRTPRGDLVSRAGRVRGAISSEPCPVCLTGAAVHDDCTMAAILWVHEGRFGTRPFPGIARVLAPVCYLCGAADTEHVEHVRPRARGGIDSWDNVAGACQRCNLVKGARSLTLTDNQTARLAIQHAAFRAAHQRVTPDFAVEALAIRAMSPSPHKNPRIAAGRVLRVMCELLFGDGLVPIDQGAPWLERALTLAHERGWLARVPDWPVEQAVAEYIERWREEERNDQREGNDFIDWRVRLDQLRRTGRDDEALEILMEMIAESDMVARNGGLPTAEWTQRAAVILRKRGDRDGEITLLRRYVAVCPRGPARRPCSIGWRSSPMSRRHSTPSAAAAAGMSHRRPTVVNHVGQQRGIRLGGCPVRPTRRRR